VVTIGIRKEYRSSGFRKGESRWNSKAGEVGFNRRHMFDGDVRRTRSKDVYEDIFIGWIPKSPFEDDDRKGTIQRFEGCMATFEGGFESWCGWIYSKSCFIESSVWEESVKCCIHKQDGNVDTRDGAGQGSHSHGVFVLVVAVVVVLHLLWNTMCGFGKKYR
jgi:hypothetical protein